MAVNQKQEVVLLHTENHKNTFYLPLKRSERIKYTCFTASKNYVVFGATSGGLYTFKRNPYSFWQLIPSKESAVTFVAISSFENFIAFATSKGIICILEFNESSCGKLVIRSDDLNDSEITALCWTEDNSKPTLYIGDSNGRVSFLKLSFLSKSILHLPTTVFMTLDSKIVQLCWLNDYLLVSTLSRCYLCDTVKEQFKQIGHQLRDGSYGACFTKNQNTRIFCARPGSRLWEVNLDAVVHSTHQFKQQLAIPPFSFISIYEEPKIIGKEQNKTEWSAQSFNFIKLYDLLGRYIFTFKKDGIYILNVDMANILFWSNYFSDIVDAQCISNTIFLWTSNGDLHELVLLPVGKCLLTLYLKKHYSLCIDIICSHFDHVTEEEQLLALHPLRDFEYSEIDSEKAEVLSNFKEKLRSVSIKGVELSSGIYMVNNAHLSSRLLDDGKLLSMHKHRSLNRSESEESRKRSHSLPSDLKKNHETNENHSSTFTIASFAQELQTNDNLYLEMGLYSSPYLTLASYDILQDSFAELGASFSEKFTESSKQLKEKWQILENKLNFLRNKTPNENNIDYDHLRNQYDDKKDTIQDEDSEPIVEVRKKKTVEVEFDFSHIIVKCDDIPENSNDIDVDKMIILLNTIVEEFFNVSEKLGLSINSSYSCFPFSLMPEKYLVMLKKILKVFFNKENLSRWFNDDLFPLKIENMNWMEKYPALFRQIFSSEDLKLDFLLSKILAIFSELLNATTILEIIKSFELPCYYMSFCYIVKYFQNGEVLERNNYSKAKNNQWPLPVYLNTMLLMISLDQIEVFYEMGLKKNIEVCDIAYLMLHLETNKPDSADKYKEIWLTYIQRICEKETNCLNNIGVLCLAIKLFVSSNDKFESYCASCWFLLPQQTYKVKFLQLGYLLMAYFWNIFDTEYSRVTNAIENDEYPYESLLLFERLLHDREYEPLSYICYKNMESCAHLICDNLKAQVQDVPMNNLRCLLIVFHLICSLCHRIPELWKYLPVLQKKSKVRLFHVPHFLQLSMIEEIETSFQIFSPEDAQKILNMNASLSKGNCLNCASKMPSCGTFSWNELAVFILRKLDVRTTLKILSEFPENIHLDKSFYRSAILTSVPGVTGELRDQVMASVGDHFDVNPVSLDVHIKLSEALKIDKSDKTLKIKPSRTNHWGISVNVEDGNQAICYCCSLPLFSKSLIKEDNGGIMVFSCSHTYHTICLKNKDCTAICLVCDRFLR